MNAPHIKRRNSRWQYRGDVNLRKGGYFFRIPKAFDDYADCVRVIPAADMGGPDNHFLIEVGSVFVPADKAKRKQALDCYGWSPETSDPAGLVAAFLNYHGVERSSPNDGDYLIQLGKFRADSHPSYGSKDAPDFVLKCNVSLRNFVRRKFCV